MQINKIDDLFDNIIDDFYNKIIIKNKQLDKIINDINFVKYQKEINDIVNEYILTIPVVKIYEIIKKGDSYNIIYNTITKYIFIYILLYIGYNYYDKDTTFINNIIEFSNNQFIYKIKINNFFTSTSNSMIIDYYYYIKNILILCTKKQVKYNLIETLKMGQETIKFISIIEDTFNNLIIKESNKKLQSHHMYYQKLINIQKIFYILI